MSGLVEEGRAKVNLTLRVVGRRTDGYHDLESVVAFADCADKLTLTPGAELTLTTVGPLATACGELSDNLVLKAARLLGEAVPDLKTGAFVLDKLLPVAAGIGGGSADAAAALRLLARLNNLSLDDERMQEVALEVGADVPVCLASRACDMTGVGENLLPLRPDDLTVEVGLVVQVEANSDQAAEILEASCADDHQAVPMDYLHRAAVVRHHSLQLADDRLDGLLKAQRLAEHPRYGQERLGVLSCAVELGDVVVDRVEADVLTVDLERHEHHLHVDELPVLPYATGDPVGATALHRLAGDLLAFSPQVLAEDEVVDRAPDRLLRRVAEELRRRRVPARHALVGVHDDDGDRADLDERLQLVQPEARLSQLGRELDFRRHRSAA